METKASNPAVEPELGTPAWAALWAARNAVIVRMIDEQIDVFNRLAAKDA